MACKTLIPQRLSYGPAGSAAGDQVCLAFDDITASEFRKGRYEVCHYARGSLGGCTGPPAIDQTLWFCHELHVRLQGEGKPVFVEYEPEQRKNVAVVVGAYLVLGRGWSARQVRGVLPEDAGLALPCSWVSPRALATSHGAPRMTVQDCWEGVQMARDQGWLRKEVVEDGVMTSLAASQFWRTSCEYDGAWLVPGVFVMADPMTTIMDPNPQTCSAFHRPSGEGDRPRGGADPTAEEAYLNEIQEFERPPTPTLFCPDRNETFLDDVKGASATAEQSLSTTSGGVRDRDDLQVRESDDESEDRLSEDNSVHTVCKAYDTGAPGNTGCDLRPDARPFVDFLQEEGIETVLRVNFSEEPGLAEIGGSYEAKLLTNSGIRHEDVPVSDAKSECKGAVPPRDAIRRFISLATNDGHDDPGGGAVLVHCKGGFGRSVFLACLLVIYKHNVSGRGLLGWARIARPGSITTPEQEAALRALSGRADLCRKYGLPCEAADDTSEAQACCTVS